MPRRLIKRLEEGIIAFLLVAMTLLVFVDVVLRFGFNTGLIWAQELTLHIAAWLVLFGASYCLKVGAHIGVDVFVKLLPPGPRRRVGLLAVALCLAYCGLLIYGAWGYLATIFRIGIPMEDLPVPLWLAHGMLLVGFALLALRCLELLWKLAKGRIDTILLRDEAAMALFETREKRHGERAERSERPERDEQ